MTVDVRTTSFYRGFRLVIALVALTLAMAHGRAQDGAAPAGRPNIVFILIDDLGAHDLGVTGSDYYQTPHIDRLAQRGMLFEQAYSNALVCSPSRASIYTGQYPARHEFTNVVIGENHDTPRLFDIGKFSETKLTASNAQHFDARHLRVVPHEQVTFAEVLQNAGYTTGFYGKWHCGYSPTFHPDKQGWSHVAGVRKFHRLPDPHWGKNWQDILRNTPDLRDEDYLSDYLAERATRFIENHHDEPFMLTLSHYLVHQPLSAKPDLAKKYKKRSGDDQRNYKYASMVEAVDQSVGRIIKTLEKHGLTDNTMLVFTSDNGGLIPWTTSNLPLLGGKSFPYEGGTRVPMIVVWPGVVEPGSRCSRRVMGMDLYPTFCDAAGVGPPDEQTLDGQSLMPLLTESGTFPERPLFWYYPHYTHAVGPHASVINDGWKLIRFFNGDGGDAYELYDLRYDPYEYKDLASKHPDKVKELSGLLDQHLRSSDAHMPRSNPSFDPDEEDYKGGDFSKNMAERQRFQLQTRGSDRPGDK